jgi:hypothetical protein
VAAPTGSVRGLGASACPREGRGGRRQRDGDGRGGVVGPSWPPLGPGTAASSPRGWRLVVEFHPPIRPNLLDQPNDQADNGRTRESYGPFPSVETKKSAFGRRKCESRHLYRPGLNIITIDAAEPFLG